MLVVLGKGESPRLWEQVLGLARMRGLCWGSWHQAQGVPLPWGLVREPAGREKMQVALFACMTVVRDGAGSVPACCKQDLISQTLTGLSKSTCANGLIKLKPVYVTNLHKEKLEPRLA